MKKIILGLILLLGVSMTACGNVSDSEKNGESFSDNYSFTELILRDSDISVEGSCTSIRIQELYYNEDEDDYAEYIVMIKDGMFWADDIWYIQYDGEKILYKKKIKKISGNIISCQEVKLSQGTYVEFYCATHMGNGSTVLWNTDTKNVEYEMSGTIDLHKEDYVGKTIIEKYNLPKIKKYDGYGYSFVYQGDMLTAQYKDINGDKKEDAIFYGVKNLVSDEYETPIAMFSVKKIFLYDTELDEFVYNEELSQEKEMK